MNDSNERTGAAGGPLSSEARLPSAPRPGLTGRLLAGFGDWLDSLPRWIVVAACLVLMAGVAVLDVATGEEASVSVFYVGPVVIATWLVSARAGLTVVAGSAAATLVVEVLTRPLLSRWTHLWNIMALTGFLLLTVFMVNLAKMAIAAERDASRTDSLTGVANSRAFQDRSALAINAMRRTRSPLTFCYLDVDYFKEVNDTLGHREGDALLSVLAESLQSRLRTTDLVARLGGDEFGILLPDTDFQAAETVLADIREAWTEAVAIRWPVGVTGGAVTFLQPPPSTDQMVNIADKLMYEVKQSGRGRIEHVTWPAENVRPARSPGPS